jgi:glycosyltransferase
MTSEPKLGIIIPSYNDPRIRQAIASVRDSDCDNLTRIYIIDGGSGDLTLTVIREALRTTDVLVSEKDAGIFDALNKGLECVREEYFGWIGSDDFFVANINFSQIVSVFQKLDVDCVLLDTIFIDDFRLRRRSFARRPSYLNYCTGRLFPHFSSFWKKQTVGDLRFDLGYKIAADIDFFLRLIAARAPTSWVENRVGTIMRIGGVSTASLRQVYRSNLESFDIYRRQLGAPIAAFAVLAKLAIKLVWTLRTRPFPVVGEILSPSDRQQQ